MQSLKVQSFAHGAQRSAERRKPPRQAERHSAARDSSPIPPWQRGTTERLPKSPERPPRRPLDAHETPAGRPGPPLLTAPGALEMPKTPRAHPRTPKSTRTPPSEVLFNQEHQLTHLKPSSQPPVSLMMAHSHLRVGQQDHCMGMDLIKSTQDTHMNNLCVGWTLVIAGLHG